MAVIRILIVLMTLGVTGAFKYFHSKIPNGDRLPNVCSIESERSLHIGNDQGRRGLWEGVGHLLPQGSGPLNAFGHDFKQNKFVSIFFN